jgi:hypothetical protein
VLRVRSVSHFLRAFLVSSAAQREPTNARPKDAAKPVRRKRAMMSTLPPSQRVKGAFVTRPFPRVPVIDSCWTISGPIPCPSPSSPSVAEANSDRRDVLRGSSRRVEDRSRSRSVIRVSRHVTGRNRDSRQVCSCQAPRFCSVA